MRPGNRPNAYSLLGKVTLFLWLEFLLFKTLSIEHFEFFAVLIEDLGLVVTNLGPRPRRFSVV